MKYLVAVLLLVCIVSIVDACCDGPFRTNVTNACKDDEHKSLTTICGKADTRIELEQTRACTRMECFLFWRPLVEDICDLHDNEWIKKKLCKRARLPPNSMSCPFLRDPKHGRTVFGLDRINYRSFAKYSCETTGFKLRHGNRKRTCQNGTWSGTAPKCVYSRPPVKPGTPLCKKINRETVSATNVASLDNINLLTIDENIATIQTPPFTILNLLKIHISAPKCSGSETASFSVFLRNAKFDERIKLCKFNSRAVGKSTFEPYQKIDFSNIDGNLNILVKKNKKYKHVEIAAFITCGPANSETLPPNLESDPRLNYVDLVTYVGYK